MPAAPPNILLSVGPDIIPGVLNARTTVGLGKHLLERDRERTVAHHTVGRQLIPSNIFHRSMALAHEKMPLPLRGSGCKKTRSAATLYFAGRRMAVAKKL